MSEHRDFDLQALYWALDDQRRTRKLNWDAVAREVNSQFRGVPGHRPIATSTITRLRTAKVSGAGALQMMLWLRRTPESFLPNFENADAQRYRLRQLGTKQILRFDTKAIYTALNAQRKSRGMTWMQVAEEIGCSPNPLSNLSKGGLTGFPIVMRILGWLGQPAAAFTRASDR